MINENIEDMKIMAARHGISAAYHREMAKIKSNEKRSIGG